MIKLQPRHMLAMGRWQPQTRQLSVTIAPQDEGYRQVDGRLEVEAGAVPTWYDPRPLVFVISNQGAPDSAIDLADVRLIGPDKRDLLVNGNFAAGGDRWFSYNDFQHLGWHL